MKEAIIMALFCLLIIFTGCSSTSVRNEEIIMKNINKSIPKAYVYNDELYIDIKSDKDIFLKGKLKNDDSNLNYQFLYDYLEIDKEDKSITKEWEKVEVLKEDLWDNVNKEILERILPKETNKGLLLVTYYYEAVLYKDKNNNVKISDLSNVPKEVEIIDKLDNDYLAKLIINILKEQNKKQNIEKILFVTVNTANYYQPFTYVDLKNEKLYYYFFNSKRSEGDLDYFNYFFNNTIGLINNPFTVTSRLISWLLNSSYVLANFGAKDLNSIPPYRKGEKMDINKFVEYLEKKSSSKIYKGKTDLLIDGEEFFLSLINSIYKAKKEVNIRTYIFDNDDYAVKIADILKAKSKEIKVKILMDKLGSVTAAKTLPGTVMPVNFKMPKSIEKYLKEDSNISVRTAKNPWFTTDHVKTLIFDNSTAYVGGMNIGREYRYEWHDVMLKVEGPIVGKLNKDFYGAWSHSGWGGDLAYVWTSVFKTDDNNMEDEDDYIELLPLYTKTGKAEIHNATLEAIKRSKGYIYIENAYFSDIKIVNELIKARERGVDVRVILPYWGNHNIMNTSNMITANSLIRNGIKIYMYPKMTHVKATLIDGWAMVGTANYDKLSMRVNQEINISFWDKKKVEELKEILFEKDFEESMEVKGEFPISWYNYLLRKVAEQF